MPRAPRRSRQTALRELRTLLSETRVLRRVGPARRACTLTNDELTFGDLLRRYRLGAGLSQEALAERAGLSPRGLSDLERGVRRAPYRDTVLRLAEALGLGEPERQALLASSRRLRACAGAHAAEPTRAVLPIPLSSFVGRKREVAEVRRLLEGTRLLTLTGTGGIGKTRLALQVAAEVVGDYPDGVWFIDLAPLANGELVARAVASALEVREQPTRPLAETLPETLGPRRALLLFDNCEHLVDACAPLANTLLRRCPGLRILATSREALRIDGETAWRVPPLALTDAAMPLEQLQQCEAVRLFADRAAAVQPRFRVTAQNAATVIRVCGRLDGLPLAIELAAAWVRLLTAEQIAQRLDARLALLVGGSRVAPARQQTLRGAIDWSYELLAEPARRLFERLAVFAGGCSLEAAEAIAGAADGSTLELLGGLVDKSLVQTDEQPDGSLRYRLLESLREYGLERLAARGEAEPVRRQHALLFLALAEQSEHELHGARQAAWQARLELEQDNLRAALRWALDAGEADVALRLCHALMWPWFHSYRWREGRQWTEQALALPGATPTRARAGALMTAGVLATCCFDFQVARQRGEAAAALARELGDDGVLGVECLHLGLTAQWQGDADEALPMFQEALLLGGRVGDLWLQARALNDLGKLALERGDADAARKLLEESLQLSRATQNAWSIAMTLNSLGDLARWEGDYPRAGALYGESLKMFAESGTDFPGRPSVLHNLAYVALAAAETRRAADLFEESLTLYQTAGERRGVAECLVGMAGVAAAEGEAERAVRLFGAADAVFEALGAARGDPARDHERDLALARAALSEEAFRAAWHAGRRTRLGLAGGLNGDEAAFSLRDGAPPRVLQSPHGG